MYAEGEKKGVICERKQVGKKVHSRIDSLFTILMHSSIADVRCI